MGGAQRAERAQSINSIREGRWEAEDGRSHPVHHSTCRSAPTQHRDAQCQPHSSNRTPQNYTIPHQMEKGGPHAQRWGAQRSSSRGSCSRGTLVLRGHGVLLGARGWGRGWYESGMGRAGARGRGQEGGARSRGEKQGREGEGESLGGEGTGEGIGE